MRFTYNWFNMYVLCAYRTAQDLTVVCVTSLLRLAKGAVRYTESEVPGEHWAVLSCCGSVVLPTQAIKRRLDYISSCFKEKRMETSCDSRSKYSESFAQSLWLAHGPSRPSPFTACMMGGTKRHGRSSQEDHWNFLLIITIFEGESTFSQLCTPSDSLREGLQFVEIHSHPWEPTFGEYIRPLVRKCNNDIVIDNIANWGSFLK